MPKKRRVIIVAEALVPLSHGGGAHNLHCEVLALKALGYQVTVVFLRAPVSPAGSNPSTADYLQDVDLVDLSQSVPIACNGNSHLNIWQRAIKSINLIGLSSRFGVIDFVYALDSLVRRVGPDIIIAQTFPALLALRKVTSVPILLEMELFPSRMHYLNLGYRVMPNVQGIRKMTALLKFPIVYASLRAQEVALAGRAAHIATMDPGGARFFERHLGRPVSVYRCPFLDQLTDRQFTKQQHKKKIIMIGHLRGLVSLCSLDYLSKYLIERMQREIGKPFELHIIGGYELPERFSHLRNYGNVILRGHIDDIEPEFRTADIVLSTSTFDFGSSTRIRAALAFGSVLVVHRNSSQGIPELVHEYNSLLCEKPGDFIQSINRCFSDPALCETIGRNARATYEKFFSLEAHRIQLASLLAMTLKQGHASS